jgi:uncharacterized protein (TIGR02118 family)
LKSSQKLEKEKHIPMVQRLLGSPLRGVAVEEGIAGAIPGSPPTYLALGHLYFESVNAFVQAWGPKAQEIVGGIPNYTNCEPIIQISPVRIDAFSETRLRKSGPAGS